jgi:NAD(P)-dependent dehydrogenase (short-subunit alcohol dehydrogenase family)
LAGIGRETARVLADRGANVFVVGRDMPKCHKVVEELKAETGKQRILLNFNFKITPLSHTTYITAMQLDLASLASVRTFAEKYLTFLYTFQLFFDFNSFDHLGIPLHLLINNAYV